MFNSDLTADQILFMENDEEIINYTSPYDKEIKVWPVIRMIVLSMIVERRLYSSKVIIRNSSLGNKFKRIISIFQHTYWNWKTLRRIKNREILITTVGYRYKVVDKYLINRIPDSLYSIANDKTVILESFRNGINPNLRQTKDILSDSPFYVTSKLKCFFLRQVHREQLYKYVDKVCDRARNLYGIEFGIEEREWLKHYTEDECSQAFFLQNMYTKLLCKLGIKLLLIQGACYGGAQSVSLIVAAKRLKIKTAEYQHGMITSGHLAYNYSPNIHNSVAYSFYLPDYILTFGEYWNNNAKIVSKMIKIGSVTREDDINSNEKKTEVNTKFGAQVLLIGDGFETGLKLDYAKELMKGLGAEFRVVFRPHPYERDVIRAFDVQGVEIDGNQNLYESLSQTYALVGEASTVLYEAIGVVKKIIMMDTKMARFYHPEAPFPRSTSVDETVRIIMNLRTDKADNLAPDYFWASSWQANYLNYISSQLVNSQMLTSQA